MNPSLALDAIDESRRFMVFLGRDTSGSLAAKAFSGWMQLFESDCDLVRLDMPRDSIDQEYIALLARLRNLKNFVGMQVTNHKVRLFQAANMCFDYCSRDVSLLEEVGGIVVSDEGFTAVSPDAAALRVELRTYLNADRPIEIVLLGGGGASRAIALVASAYPSVRKITITEIDSGRRGALRKWVEALRNHGGARQIEVLSGDANDEVTFNAAQGSLIVNASGMGKDMAGSPISQSVEFPSDSIVWDLNYRGELTFLTYAHSQKKKRALVVNDGFALFIRNWTWLLESVLGKKLDDRTRTALWQMTQLLRNED